MLGRPEVTTELGRLRGSVRGPAEVFLGVPYAAPPVGELRFRAPRAATPWSELRDAARFGSRCPQAVAHGVVVGEEDCLTLNIWRPKTPAATPGPAPALRPVMVYLHGGANVLGTGGDPLQDGSKLAAEGEVVVVSINYRLGLLGFLAHPQLRAESGTSGNWAHLDQIAALEWVARNIEAFGGDPDRVTIFGHSAGALGVCVLLASPLARGLFHGAILQSGGCDVASLDEREREGLEHVAASDCVDAPDPIACLRDLPVDELVALAPAFVGPGTDWRLPVAGAVDGHVLLRSPWASFAAGEHAVVPTLVGTTTEETVLFTSKSITSCSTYARAVRRGYPEFATELLLDYPCADDAAARATFVDLSTDALFGCQARRIARALTAQASGAAPVHRYVYAYTRGDPAVRELGAFHGAELQMLFGTFERLGYVPPAGEAELSARMRQSWASFAHQRGPVTADTPGWAAYEAERDNAVIFDWPVSVSDGVSAAHCDRWDARAASPLAPSRP